MIGVVGLGWLVFFFGRVVWFFVCGYSYYVNIVFFEKYMNGGVCKVFFDSDNSIILYFCF